MFQPGIGIFVGTRPGGGRKRVSRRERSEPLDWIRPVTSPPKALDANRES